MLSDRFTKELKFPDDFDKVTKNFIQSLLNLNVRLFTIV